jgi:hypothetical protein
MRLMNGCLIKNVANLGGGRPRRDSATSAPVIFYDRTIGDAVAGQPANDPTNDRAQQAARDESWAATAHRVRRGGEVRSTKQRGLPVVTGGVPVLSRDVSELPMYRENTYK